MTVRAIETRYAGCRFRSRLEARWAVFFDHLGIAWEYEPQGFQIFGGEWYLPDFFLPAMNTWVEVKGQVGPSEMATIVNAVDYGGLPGIEDAAPTSAAGLLLLTSIPRLNPPEWPLHPLYKHHKGVVEHWGVFTDQGLAEYGTTGEAWTAAGNDKEFPSELAQAGVSYEFVLDLEAVRWGINRTPPQDRSHQAYLKARSARFEHGENG